MHAAWGQYPLHIVIFKHISNFVIHLNSKDNNSVVKQMFFMSQGSEIKCPNFYSGRLRNLLNLLNTRSSINAGYLTKELVSKLGLELGCVRLGNPDLDFQNLNPDFPIEREIRKRISTSTNPFSGWISIKKSKSGFFGFPFLSLTGKSEKGFGKPFRE